MPSGGSQRHPRVTCWDSGLRGACALDRCNCSVQRSAAGEGEVPVFTARALCPGLDLCAPRSGSKRHPGVICWGRGLRDSMHWIGMTAMSRVSSWAAESCTYCCGTPVPLDVEVLGSTDLLARQ